jgi:Uma2 family endonuclease
MTTATATQPQPKTLLTAEDLWNMPEDGNHYELVRGELISMPTAGAEHSTVAARLEVLLGYHVLTHGLGETTIAEGGYLLKRNPDTLRAPDVAFISKERLPVGGIPPGYWTIAPDLAVEVVSPSERPDDIQSKIIDYLTAGTRMVWVIYPRTRSVTVYRSLAEVRVLTDIDILSGEDVVPGFNCNISQLFVQLVT